jgi:hypothetical protein
MPLSTSKRPVTERDQLLGELVDTQNQLHDAHARFNLVTHPELIEQCVYEISALKARHAFYIRVLREEEGA